MTIPLDNLCQSLAQLAPLKLAESWDNVGLLIGDRSQTITRVMTCLTISPTVVDEAVAENADVIITHHPLPFQPLAKITSDNVTGVMLLRLIRAGVAIYSAHTAFDSAADGINTRWTNLFQLTDVAALIDPQDDVPLGSGRYGKLAAPSTAAEILVQASQAVGATCPRLVGESDHIVNKIGFACGSGGSFLPAARRRGCDLLITGEANFHSCLEAESTGIALGLLGHYWSERFAMEYLAAQLSKLHPDLTIWPSHQESDPVHPLVR
ncbi:Nif3-like dinuclear metal center hexameric protein [Stieleria varia]|uniref:GTP cyclohydrolase 1 type 2 homolog n=1 Tax=Stieleria varia TaxID=2528005 RepID=A0A5C6A3B1_9BACT|nr:Nif3-like dinuclear metal center hexameric protein [Stieleria varia]TWT94392.1 GTP cyclohydrolase 1 type 2 [Stieleria varia]